MVRENRRSFFVAICLCITHIFVSIEAKQNISALAKKNTEAEAYLADVKVWAEQVQASWTVLAGVKNRIIELHDLTTRLREKAETQMNSLEELAQNFDPNNEGHVKLFQQCAIMAKSMSELAQTPILDADGNISEQSGIVASKTETILNTEL